MSNSTNWDEKADFLFDATMYMIEHMNSQSDEVKISTVIISNPQKLLACRTSVEVAAKVMEEIITHFLGEKPPSKLIQFIGESINKDIKTYAGMFDIIRIWDIPIASSQNLSLDATVPAEEIGGEQAYLWEGLIDQLGDKPGKGHF